mgnify:CR=1 FL=1
MKYTQALKDENVRFEEELKRAKEQHTLAQAVAKKDMARKVFTFAEGHYIGEWVYTHKHNGRTRPDLDNTYWSQVSSIGRYVNMSGEPTSLYLIKKDECERGPPDYLKKRAYVGVCVLAESSACVDNIKKFLEWGNHPFALRYSADLKEDTPVQSILFSFRRTTTQDSTRGGRLCREKHESGELCDIDIDELEIGASPFETLIANIVREQRGIKSEEEVLEEARRKLRDE